MNGEERPPDGSAGDGPPSPRQRRRGGGRHGRRRKGNEGPPLILLIDKPSGPTSHDMVREARRWTGLRRIGHGGTLDPLATGLLPLFVGPATRLNEYLGAYDKEYEATVLLGESTDTDDSEGETLATAPIDGIAAGDVEHELAQFRGEIDQLPPLYSAIKRGGVAAHRAARAGEPVELEPRRVAIHELSLTAYEPPHARIAMRVSTGTYVRAIARDLGRALGCGAHVTAMRRTAIGRVRAEDARPPAEFEQAAEAGEIWSLADPPTRLFQDWPAIPTTGDRLARVLRGQSVRAPAQAGREFGFAVDAEDRVIAVLRNDPAAPDRWNPEKVLRPD